MKKCSPPYRDTGRSAFVEMGKWTDDGYELEGEFPVVKLSNGEHAVLLGNEELPRVKRKKGK